MSRKIYLGFLWHMHQPYYRDPVEDIYILPWVRLHTVNAYYTMPRFASRYENLRMTFNIVPSLLEQLKDYSEGRARDLFEQYSRMVPEELNPVEKSFLLRNFFMVNWDTSVRPYGRYNDLLDKRGPAVREEEYAGLVRNFNDQDILDLQTWFNLAWVGPAARDDEPEIAKLIRKGRFFTIDERNFVLDYHYTIIKRVLLEYKKLADSGRAELTTTPFYHPILPLICDTSLANESHPGVPLPQRYQHAADAEAQVEKGRAYFAEVFGVTPSGMWPSEGSVSMEALSIASAKGVKWAATDEEVLLKSIGVKGIREELIYKPYMLKTETGEMSLFFRDKRLSDLIGFTYSRNIAKPAVDDFIERLAKSVSYVPQDKGPVFVSVILDGENPWEYYPEGGRFFLDELFSQLEKTDWIETSTFSHFLEQNPPPTPLERISSGSWISANFDIWIGKSETNKAWGILGQARDLLIRHMDEHPQLTDETKAEVMRCIYRAEGSDWFWWFDDEFSTDTKAQFDYLFRINLIKAFSLLDIEAPDFLKNPVRSTSEAASVRNPTDFISPVIDGEITSFFEWANAGEYDVTGAASAMFNSGKYIDKIRFGFDTSNLFLCLSFPEPEQPETDEQFTIQVRFSGIGKTVNFKWSRDRKEPAVFQLIDMKENEEPRELRVYDNIASGRVIELGIPFADLGLSPGDVANFLVAISRNRLEVARIPEKGFIRVDVPDQKFPLKVWSV